MELGIISWAGSPVGRIGSRPRRGEWCRKAAGSDGPRPPRAHDRRHSEFLAFLKQVAGAYPRRRLQVICDNYATDKQPVVQGWLAKHPRVMLHFTPTSAT